MPAVGMIVTAYTAGCLSCGGLMWLWVRASLQRADVALRAANARLRDLGQAVPGTTVDRRQGVGR